ncbi:MAG: LLM class F420-dependent oxidoreductase [Microthrixaceae bacterium]|nr:LLM class F420-dependent oxidoreductase [Microthrixaceae bacterium]
MKFGIMFANTMNFASRDGLIQLARGAEESGFESLWTVEHVVFPDNYESTYPYDRSGKMAMDATTALPDPLIWLTWVAAVTTTLRLGTGILILPQRNPVILAKTLSTIDSLSGGRMELGVGAGWLQEEFDALGIPFEGRGARMDESIQVLRTLWGSDHAAFEGTYHSFSGVSVNPKPANGTVPIHVGGHTRRAAERAGRLGDGFFPGRGSLPELVEIARSSALAADRDPDSLVITSGSPGVLGDDPVGAVEELASQGVDRIMVPSFIFLNDTAETLRNFGETVIAPTAHL